MKSIIKKVSKKILVDSSILVLKQVIFVVIGFASQIIVVRALTKENYGLIVYISSIVGMLGFLGLSSLTTTTTTTVAKGKYGNYLKSSKQIIILGFIGGLCLSLFGMFKYIYTDEVVLSVMLLSVGLHGPGLWFNNHIARWIGERRYTTQLKYEISIRLFQLALTVLLVSFFATPIVLILSYFSIRSIASLVVASLHAREIQKNKLDIGFDEKAHRYGWRTSIYGNVLTVVATQFHRVFFAVCFGPVALASFAIGEMVRNHGFMALYSIYQTISVPILSRKEPKDAVATLVKILPLFLLFMISIGVICALLLNPLILFFFGNKYYDSITWGYAFILLGVISAPSKAILPVFKALSLTRQTLIQFWTGSLGKLILVPSLTVFYGKKGVVLGLLISALLSGVVAVSQLMHLKRKIESTY